MELEARDISFSEEDQDEWTLANFFTNSVESTECQYTDLSRKINGLLGIVPLADDFRCANSTMIDGTGHQTVNFAV
jgi:hypothetical protein